MTDLLVMETTKLEPELGSYDARNSRVSCYIMHYDYDMSIAGKHQHLQVVGPSPGVSAPLVRVVEFIGSW